MQNAMFWASWITSILFALLLAVTAVVLEILSDMKTRYKLAVLALFLLGVAALTIDIPLHCEYCGRQSERRLWLVQQLYPNQGAVHMECVVKEFMLAKVEKPMAPPPPEEGFTL